MKRCAWILAFLITVVPAGAVVAETPHQVGPFALNRPLSDFSQYVSMETSMPVRYMEYINEVEIAPIKGFKSGLIAYSTCDSSQRVVRIKLKYDDGSKKFFESLLKRIEKKFGKSEEYRGDPFRIVIAWKWSFRDKDDNRISLIVQHNTRDEEEKMGNSIKLTMTSMMEEAQRCYEKRISQSMEGAAGRKEGTEIPGLSGWDLFLPR